MRQEGEMVGIDHQPTPTVTQESLWGEERGRGLGTLLELEATL